MNVNTSNSPKIPVAILAGGNSHEREISLRSANQMQKELQKSKRYIPYTIDIDQNEWRLIPSNPHDTGQINLNNFSLYLNNENIPLKVALLATHGAPGENGLLQGYLQLLRIPYTTGSILTQALSFHKSLCKQHIQHLVHTLPSLDLRNAQQLPPQEIIQQLGLPLFVKPNDNGSSFGVKKAHNEKELQQAIEFALSISGDIMIEKAATGTELTCGVVRIHNKTYALPITEIIPPDEFFNPTNKYDNSSQEITPARIPQAIAEQIQEQTVQLFQYLGCKGFARADFILQDNTPYFLEVNTIPGMTATSLVPKQLQAIKISFLEFLEALLDQTLEDDAQHVPSV